MLKTPVLGFPGEISVSGVPMSHTLNWSPVYILWPEALAPFAGGTVFCLRTLNTDDYPNLIMSTETPKAGHSATSKRS